MDALSCLALESASLYYEVIDVHTAGLDRIGIGI